MKKFILSVFACALLFGCSSGKKDMAPKEDPAAELSKLLDSYTHACADAAFKDARADMAEVYRFRDEGKSNESDEAYRRARENYEQGVVAHQEAIRAIDAANTEINAQKSRLNDLKNDGMKYASKEYSYTVNRVNTLHASAASDLEKCDIDAAQAKLNEAEKELRYLEDLVAMRMNAAVKTPPPATETYTVVKGDSLWKIAAHKYSNPYFWPLIYWSNRSMIKDPDLIFPNQKFVIEKNQDAKTKSEAERFARTRGHWSLFDNK